jgi:hypothetical protein
MISSLSVVRPWRVVVAVGLVAAGLLLSGAARASAATCKRVQTPNVGSGQNYLSGVAVTSSGNAWAVGYYSNPSETHSQTLIEHWKGTAWIVQASPSPGGSGYSWLSGVAATSPTNAWAVGGYGKKGASTGHGLIVHWNGKAWTVQASPNPAGSSGAGLSGVAATSSTNAWAVGDYQYRNGTSVIWKLLIEHWNGKAWTVQASPNPGGSSSSRLSGVAATSSHNAWAVGDYGYPNGSSVIEKTLIEHWNGRGWKVQASPTPQFFQDQSIQLSGVAATSATNAWAVGGAEDIPSPEHALFNPEHTLIEHWNGRGWTVQASPNPGEPFGSELYDVAATSSTNAWAVGENYDVNAALIEHWNGSAWTLQASPDLGAGTLSGVAATSSRNAWAVGDSPEHRTLIEHCG